MSSTATLCPSYIFSSFAHSVLGCLQTERWRTVSKQHMLRQVKEKSRHRPPLSMTSPHSRSCCSLPAAVSGIPANIDTVLEKMLVRWFYWEALNLTPLFFQTSGIFFTCALNIPAGFSLLCAKPSSQIWTFSNLGGFSLRRLKAVFLSCLAAYREILWRNMWRSSEEALCWILN